jgi:hypothetical protein
MEELKILLMEILQYSNIILEILLEISGLVKKVETGQQF